MTSPSGRHPLAGHTVDQLSRPPLPNAALGQRGYHKPTVDKVLANLAEYIDALRVDLSDALRALRHREQEIEQRRYGIRLPSTAQGELVHEGQLTWHLEAQRHGDQITAAAQAQASRIVDDAQQHADRIHAAARRPDGEIDKLRTALDGMRQLLQNLAQHVDFAEDSIRQRS